MDYVCKPYLQKISKNYLLKHQNAGDKVYVINLTKGLEMPIFVMRIFV